jgi:predicted nucleotidyltransferase component of viral defense system
MHAVFGLNQLGLKFELKGRTSLSKGFGVIHRFSEDIDIRIEPFDGLHVDTNPNHEKDGILLEVGFDQTAPNRALTIDSWVIQFAEAKKLRYADTEPSKSAATTPNTHLSKRFWQWSENTANSKGREKSLRIS